MRTVCVSSRQYEILRSLATRDLRTLHKRPHLLRESKHLIKACRKVIVLVERLHRYSSARKRETAYKRIVKVCSHALERIDA